MDPDNYFYSNGYTHDINNDIWYDSEMCTLESAPGDPGYLTGSDSWDVWDEGEGGDYAVDYWTSDWFVYDDGAWVPSDPRPTNYIGFSDNWAYDTTVHLWFDTTLSMSYGGPGVDFTGPTYFVTQSEGDYAYDSGQWYQYNYGMEDWG